MEQDLFNWEDSPPTQEEDVTAYTWQWWTDWPTGLSQRECYMRQISRDRRALEECAEHEIDFFAQRIVAFRKAIIEVDGGDSPPADNATAAPREE